MTSSSDHPRPVNKVTSVPLLDVNRSNQGLRREIQEAIAKVCDSGRFLYGPDVARLEGSVASVCDVEHAVGCASGSDALLLALMALDIGPGDEVITPSFTFFATASCIWRLGAKIVFADIDPVTFNLDPEAVERSITPATKAIIPVHLFGQCAEMDALCGIAADHNVRIVEDAAQAIGAEYKGRPAGGIGDFGCFSFYPTKNLGGFGDGGMVTTNCEKLAKRVRKLAAHGMQPRYYHSEVGVNSRLDSIQAAVLSVKITQLGRWTNERRENASRYRQLISQAGLDSTLALPVELPDRYHVWNQFTLRVPGGRRDEVRTQLAERQIGSEIYYPVPLHMQECFRAVGFGEGSLPVTEQAARDVLSLPIFPELTDQELQAVVHALREVVTEERAAA